jgi:hypothetical protein
MEERPPAMEVSCEYIELAVPGHALLWLIPVTWKSKEREEAHVSNMFNVPMPVGIQYFLWFLLLKCKTMKTDTNDLYSRYID